MWNGHKKLKNINFLDEKGQTQLHEAAQDGVLDICKLIVRYEEDWNPENEDERLHLNLLLKMEKLQQWNFLDPCKPRKVDITDNIMKK